MSEFTDLLERARDRFPAPEMPIDHVIVRRERRVRNQRIAAGVVGIAVFVVVTVGFVTTFGSSNRIQPGGAGTGPAATGPAETGPETPITDWDDVGLPPEGTIPSSPETGELIAESITDLGDGDVFVYADGRVIWNAQGLYERRLTPEGVDLVRSGAIQPEDLNPGPGWAPAGRWADGEARPYVPPRYAVCYTVNRDVNPSTLQFFPPPARAILRGAVSHGVVGGAAGDPASPECSSVTISEAWALEEIWADVRIEDSEGHEATPWVYPMLPHGPGFNSGA